MDDKLKLKLGENRRRVEEEYMKNRVRCRPDILRQKAGPAGNKRKASAAPDPAPGKKRNVDDAPTFTSFCNKDLELKLKLMENRLRVEEEYRKNRVHCCPDILRQKAWNKKKAPAPAPGIRSKVHDAPTSKPGTSFCNRFGHHFVFLFEFASGYALFNARGMYEYPGFLTTFKIAEKYLNNDPFTLRAFYPFSSPNDALVQMKAICKSTVTKELKSFLVDNIPEPISDFRIAVGNTKLGLNIFLATRISTIGGQIIDQVMRGLRVKIEKFIAGLEPGDLKTAQLNLARDYRRQSCVCKESCMVQRNFHTVLADKVVVVPHKFEGLFIAKGLGKKNFICTKNLVPGKVLYGDKLISVKNEDDGTEVEYRVWNPHMSKLAAAVLGGLTNIWIKPGSHVLYLGDVCGITVLQLSDLVGSDSLVYVIGLSDAVAKTVEERSNVVTFPENFCFRKDYMVSSKDYRMDLGMDYRMVVGMVDVILGDIVYPDPSCQVNYIARYALLHLKSGGHYLISTRAKNINSTSQVKDPFADHDELPLYMMRIEFETNELVMLEPIGRGHAMAVGGYRLGK